LDTLTSSFATLSRAERRAAKKQNRKQKGKAALPKLEVVLKKLFMKVRSMACFQHDIRHPHTDRLLLQVHPDLFGQHPEQQECNDKSFQRLMGFFDSIKNGSEAYPPAQTLDLPFYIRDGDGFKQIALCLELNGGDCAGVVESDLGEFLEQIGVAKEFDWGIYTWGVGTAAERQQDPNQKE
jgi:hypothetical protein